MTTTSTNDTTTTLAPAPASQPVLHHGACTTGMTMTMPTTLTAKRLVSQCCLRCFTDDNILRQYRHGAGGWTQPIQLEHLYLYRLASTSLACAVAIHAFGPIACVLDSSERKQMTHAPQDFGWHQIVVHPCIHWPHMCHFSPQRSQVSMIVRFRSSTRTTVTMILPPTLA